MSNVRYRPAPGAPRVELEVPDPWAVLDLFEKRYPSAPNPARDARFEAMMARRKAAPQAPCTARSDSPEVPAATPPASTPAAREYRLANPPGKSTGGEHRLPAQPAALAGVRDTSMAAYRALEWSGKLTRQQRLLTEFFLASRQRAFTRQEISQAMGWGINVVCGRVNELMRAPLEFLVEVEKRTCRVTGETAAALELRRVDAVDTYPRERAA